MSIGITCHAHTHILKINLITFVWVLPGFFCQRGSCKYSPTCNNDSRIRNVLQVSWMELWFWLKSTWQQEPASSEGSQQGLGKLSRDFSNELKASGFSPMCGGIQAKEWQQWSLGDLGKASVEMDGTAKTFRLLSAKCSPCSRQKEPMTLHTACDNCGENTRPENKKQEWKDPYQDKDWSCPWNKHLVQCKKDNSQAQYLYW